MNDFKSCVIVKTDKPVNEFKATRENLERLIEISSVQQAINESDNVYRLFNSDQFVEV